MYASRGRLFVHTDIVIKDEANYKDGATTYSEKGTIVTRMLDMGNTKMF